MKLESELPKLSTDWTENYLSGMKFELYRIKLNE